MASESMKTDFWPHPVLKKRWVQSDGYRIEGNAQLWVQRWLYLTITGIRARNLLELGCFRGVTTGWMACAVEANGGGEIVAVDNDKDAIDTSRAFIASLKLKRTQVVFVQKSTFDFILDTDLTPVDFVFLDDDKEAIDVKIAGLRNKNCRALLACHDVDRDATQWQTRYGTVLPMQILHEAGHIGLCNL